MKVPRGPLAWMVDHGVAPNLLMVLFIVGGLMASLAIKKEVFPEFDIEVVQVTISYPAPRRRMWNRACCYRWKPRFPM